MLSFARQCQLRNLATFACYKRISETLKCIIYISAGKLVHVFKGFAGAIRYVQCHSSLPLVASCGLDRYLHVHNIDTQTAIAQGHYLHLVSFPLVKM